MSLEKPVFEGVEGEEVRSVVVRENIQPEDQKTLLARLESAFKLLKGNADNATTDLIDALGDMYPADLAGFEKLLKKNGSSLENLAQKMCAATSDQRTELAAMIKPLRTLVDPERGQHIRSLMSFIADPAATKARTGQSRKIAA